MTLNNVMNLKNYDYLDRIEIENFFETFLLKHQINIALNKSFKNQKYGTLFFNASKANYWNTNRQYSQYQFGYSNIFNQLSYSLGFSKSNNIFNTNAHENKFYISFSLPLDFKKSRAHIYSNIQHVEQQKSTTAYIGASSTFGENNQGSYSLSTNNNWHESNTNSSLSANLGYNFSKIKVNSSVNHGKNSSQYGLNLRGAIVGHPYGITATNNISDTFTIIHAKNAKNADIENSFGTKIDRFGNAIYTNLSPYEKNNIAINIKNLPLNIALIDNQAEVIPRRYSSTLVHLETEKTSNLLLNVITPENILIPIGFQVKNSANERIGTFGQSNQFFIDNEELLKDEISIK